MSRQLPAPPFEASMLATHSMPICLLQPASVPRSSRSWSPPPHCSSEHVSTLPRSRSPPSLRSQPYGVRAVETATLDVAGDARGVRALENVERLEDEEKVGHHHAMATLTKTRSGAMAKLQTVGESLGDDLTIQDANGNIKAGVGIYLLHEWLYGIYVEKITPKGPADLCGMIKEGDILISVNGCRIQPNETLETVRPRILGPPGSTVEMEFVRTLQNRMTEQFSVSLVRCASTRHFAKSANDVLDEAYCEIARLTAEAERMAIEKRHLQFMHSKELEEYRVQVRELKEQNVSLSVEHAKEIQSKNSDAAKREADILDAAKREADILRRQMSTHEQSEEKSDGLRREKDSLARDVEKLKAEKEHLQKVVKQLLNSSYL